MLAVVVVELQVTQVRVLEQEELVVVVLVEMVILLTEQMEQLTQVAVAAVLDKHYHQIQVETVVQV
jgi:hypothetical protein